jgi:PAS domain S-box-containing protein
MEPRAGLPPDIGADISDRLADAESGAACERLLRSIADTAPVFIAYCTPEGRYRFVNRAYAARFGLTPAECVGKAIAEVIGPAAAEQVRPYVARAVAGQTVEFEVDARYPLEGRHFMECRYAPHFTADGTIEGFVVVVADATAKRELQEALTAANAQKDQFLAVLSHELRNHLSPLNAAASILRAGAAPERVERAHAVVQRQLSHLGRLVDDLLDITRISRGELSIVRRAIDLRDVIQGSIEVAQPRIAAHRQQLHVDLPDAALPIRGDEDRLTQAFTNLLVNAAKFTPDAGAIRIRARAIDNAVEVEISDTGIGIAPDLLPHIFMPFRHGRTPEMTSHEGLGLGLHIVQSVVEMHDGAVEAYSDGIGKGARFVVTLASDDANRSRETEPAPN